MYCTANIIKNVCDVHEFYDSVLCMTYLVIYSRILFSFFVETNFHWAIGLLETKIDFPKFQILTAVAEDWGQLSCDAVLVDEQFTVFWGTRSINFYTASSLETRILNKPSIFLLLIDNSRSFSSLSRLSRLTCQHSRTCFLKRVSCTHIPADMSTNLFPYFQNTQRTSLLMLHFMCWVKAKGIKCPHRQVICRHFCTMTIGSQQWKRCSSKV
jgi:hypothetical protein